MIAPITVARVRERTAGGRATSYVVAALVAAIVAQVLAVAVLRRVFVDSIRGQLLDTAALAGNHIGESYVEGIVDAVLDALTVVSVAAAIAAIGFIALARGRVMLAAVATTMVIGANITTQVLKAVIERPDLGVDVARAAAGNSLPSGHTTVAASVAVALVFVLPPTLRGLAGLVGAGYAALGGVATLSAGWHRPSDAVAALLVVGIWAAAGLALLTRLHSRDGSAAPLRPHRLVLGTLLVTGVALLAMAVVAMAVTYQELATPTELLGRGRLLTAYAGGAVGIAGTAAMVMAMVVAAVPYAVPSRPD